MDARVLSESLASYLSDMVMSASLRSSYPLQAGDLRRAAVGRAHALGCGEPFAKVFRVLAVYFQGNERHPIWGRDIIGAAFRFDEFISPAYIAPTHAFSAGDRIVRLKRLRQMLLAAGRLVVLDPRPGTGRAILGLGFDLRCGLPSALAETVFVAYEANQTAARILCVQMSFAGLVGLVAQNHKTIGTGEGYLLKTPLFSNFVRAHGTSALRYISSDIVLGDRRRSAARREPDYRPDIAPSLSLERRTGHATKSHAHVLSDQF